MLRWPPRVRRSSYDRALPCWRRRPYSPPRSYLGAVSRPCGPGSLRAGSSCRSGMGPPAQCTVDPWLVCRSVPFPRLPNSPRCGLLRDRFRYRFRPEGDLARGERASGTGKEPADIQGAACRKKTAAPFGAAVRTTETMRPVQGPGHSRSYGTPTSILSPPELSTEIGCNATVRLEPPTRTLAPRPAAMVTSTLAPK